MINYDCRWYAKLFWIVVLLGATTMWIVHSVVLIQSYIAFNTTSQVVISSGTLNFPTVSLCNINPVREGQIDNFGNDNLRDLLELLTPKNSFASDMPGSMRKKVNKPNKFKILYVRA